MSCTHPETLRTPAGVCVLCAPEAALTKPELAAMLARLPPDVLHAERQRRSLAEFFRAGWHVLEPTTPLAWSWHLEEITAHVQAVIEDWAARQADPTHVQRVRNLLVSAGPGTLKSRIGVYALPWAWLRWPTLRAIFLSTNPRVAMRDSLYAREVIASSWYRDTFAPSWNIRDDQDAKGSFMNTMGGFRNAMGWDARIVGERGDLIYVDDPHDVEEATSDAQRRSVLERWDASIGNRLNDLSTSIRIAIAHRVHENDWAAARIAEGNWCELRLPTEYEADHPCTTPLGGDRRTVDGESIHPARYTPEVIASEKARLGALRWAAIHQQRPAPAGGALVKAEWLRFHKRPGAPDGSSRRPRGCFEGPAVETPSAFDGVCIAADLAGGKLTKSGDYNVIVAVGKKGSAFHLLDVWRARADFPEVQRVMRSFAARWPGARKVVEAAASGSALVASLASEIPGLIGQPPKGDKVSNMQSVLAFFEAGNVYLDEHAAALAELVTELITFPNAAHDDFADALRLALQSLANAATAAERDQLVRTLVLTGRSKVEAERQADRILARKYRGATEPDDKRVQPDDAQTFERERAELTAMYKALGKEPPEILHRLREPIHDELQQRDMLAMHEEYARRARGMAGGPLGAMGQLFDAFDAFRYRR